METVLYVHNDFEIVQREGRLFVHVDAGAHFPILREDEITVEEFHRMVAGPESCTRALIELQNRLIAQGVDPYKSNWKPRDADA